MIGKRASNLARVVTACVVLGGCVTATRTIYTPYDQADTTPPLFTRQVRYLIRDAFYRDPPDCVVVLSSSNSDKSPYEDSVERAFARHLTQKFSRVVGPVERRRTERRLAIDLSRPDGRKRFARETGCGAFLRWTTLEASADYVLVWSRRRFGLEAEMFRASDGLTLWKASHKDGRSDGGLPLSPFSVPFTAFEATRFHRDTEILASMVEDVVRRIVVTIPDLG